MIIFKSFQILLNFKDYKVVNSLIFIFSIPICYTSPTTIKAEEIEADPFIIKDLNTDYHL
jgi:hypothetical protein